MSTYYMLNLVFNSSDNHTWPNGRFVDYAPGQPPLLTSKAWLEATSMAPGGPDPNDSTQWTFFHKDAQHLSFAYAQNAGPNLWVRVYDFNQQGGSGPTPTDTYNARITILIARNTQVCNAPQPISSPIVNSTYATGPFTMSDSVMGPATTTPGSSSTIASWVAKLGQANQGLGASGTKNKYIMVVAATVVTGALQTPTVTYTLSHDPDVEMDM